MTWQHTGARTARALLYIIGLLALCSAPAIAGTITVCSSGCNYTSIQDAIDNAGDGDTIAVMNGTYYETITIDKSLLLQGESPEGTIINGTYSGNVVNVTADNVQFHGFSVTGSRRPLDVHEMPAGIFTNGTSNVLISGCLVTDCYLGIYGTNTIGLTVTDCEVFGNNLTGIETINADLTMVSSCDLHDNVMGLLCAWTHRMHCVDNTLSHNVRNGVCFIDGLTDSFIERNLIQDNCYAYFTDVGEYNQAGAYLEFLQNCTISNNNLIHNGGLALFIAGMNSSVLEDNVMEDNYAGFSYNEVDLDPGNSITTTNTIDGTPVLYIEGAEDLEITSLAPATVYCISCENVRIHDLVLTQRNGFGITARGGSEIVAENNTVTGNVFQNILFAATEDSLIAGNLVANATYGCGVIDTFNVTVSGNTASGNENGLAAALDCSDVHISGNTVNNNTVGIGFEFVTGDETDCSQNTIHGGDSEMQDVGIYLSESTGIFAHHNTISGLYEGVWITGGDSHTVTNSSIDDCTFGIEISPVCGAGGCEPVRYHTITGNNVTTEDLAFFIKGPEFASGNRVYLNNFSSEQDPGVSQGSGNLSIITGDPFRWGLHRSATVSSGIPAPASGDDDENVFHTDTPVTYRYNDIYFTGYLGNYWNWFNGTDSDGNGVGTIPYPVVMDNTDAYPLISPVSAYAIGPVPSFYANFTAAPIGGPAPLTVQFTDTSTGTPILWLYKFGDGFSSSAKNPRYTYRSPGNYTASLTIWKMEGQQLVSTTTRKPAFISVTGLPVPALDANFTATPLSGPAPLTVTFIDTSTGSPEFWSYDFGDGATSPTRNSTHTYRSAGTYTVSLTVMKRGERGLIRDTVVKQGLVNVTGTPVPALAANFTAAPQSGPVPLTVSFTDTSTGSPDYWSYDFGDGTTSPAANPTHTYRATGTYTVTLTVMKSSSEGLIRNTTVKQNLITVTGTPVPALAANFTAIPLSGPAPLAVTFADTSTGSPDYWNYDFGDGTTSPVKNSTHTYRAPGTYTVTLTVMKISSEGLIRNTTIKQNLITVTGSPVPALAANFTAAPLSGPIPLKVTFTDTSTGNPQFWNYEFGDGTSSTSKNPSHTYLLPGNYTVTLTVIRPEGSTLLRNSTTRQNLIRAG